MPCGCVHGNDGNLHALLLVFFGSGHHAISEARRNNSYGIDWMFSTPVVSNSVFSSGGSKVPPPTVVAMAEATTLASFSVKTLSKVGVGECGGLEASAILEQGDMERGVTMGEELGFVIFFIGTISLFFISSFQSLVYGSGIRGSFLCLLVLKCFGRSARA